MNHDPNTVQITSRAVIERKLLDVLESDSNKVAIIATQDDLQLIIAALREHHTEAALEMMLSLMQLHREAFGKEGE